MGIYGLLDSRFGVFKNVGFKKKITLDSSLYLKKHERVTAAL
jgi:hypothetical protein